LKERKKGHQKRIKLPKKKYGIKRKRPNKDVHGNAYQKLGSSMQVRTSPVDTLADPVRLPKQISIWI